jgi:hypothetical protein
MPPETETLDTTETLDAGAETQPDEGADVSETSDSEAETTNESETTDAGDETDSEAAQGDEKDDTKAGQQADPGEKLTVTRAEINELVRAMSRQAAVEEQRLQREQQREQSQKPTYKSAWERNPALANVKPEARSATQMQVEAVLEDYFASKGWDLGAMGDLPGAMREVQGLVYSTRFEKEAREAAEAYGIKPDELKKADEYARSQWSKNRTGDYHAMFAEYVYKRDAAKRDADLRAEKKGRQDKLKDQRNGDTRPGSRGGEGTKEYVPSKAAREAMAQGDSTVMLAEMRKMRGLV